MDTHEANHHHGHKCSGCLVLTADIWLVVPVTLVVAVTSPAELILTLCTLDMGTTPVLFDLHSAAWARLGFDNLPQVAQGCFQDSISPKDMSWL